MNKIIYETYSSSYNKCIPIEIVRETESTYYKMVRGKEVGFRKSNTYYKYFETTENAREYHIDRLEKEIKRLTDKKAYLESELDNVKIFEF